MVARKISQSANFKESVRYVLRQGRHADKSPPVLWGVCNLAPDERSADRLAWEMHQTALHADRLKELAGVPKKHRKHCKKPVLHRFFSYGDYIPGGDEIRRDVASHLRALGLEKQECVWSCHNDNGHFHVHLIVNKIDTATGTAAKLDDDYKKADAWRLQWDAAHAVVIADNDNKATETPRSAKDRGEWAERRYIDRETFADAARMLHGELNQQQRTELKAFCKAKSAEWVTAARGITAPQTKQVLSRNYAEQRTFSQAKRHYRQGYWTSEVVPRTSRRGKLYISTRRRYVRGHVRLAYASWTDRYFWARNNAGRFQAAGMKPPGLWGCISRSDFMHALAQLHTAEKQAAFKAAQERRRNIIAGLKADALADLKRRHRAAHEAITPDRVRDAAAILMAAKPRPPRKPSQKTRQQHPYRSNPGYSQERSR